MYRLRWTIEMSFRMFNQLLGCEHLFSTNRDGVEIQASCLMIACMLILIDTGRRPDKAMFQMVRFSLDGWASIDELEAFIATRR